MTDPNFAPSSIRRQLLNKILSIWRKSAKFYKERVNIEAMSGANTSFLIASIYQQFVDKKDRKNVEFEAFLPFPDAYGHSKDLKKINNKNSLSIKSKRILSKLLKAGKVGSHLYGMLAPYWDMTNKSEGID